MGWLRIHSKHKVNKEEKMTEIEEAKKKILSGTIVKTSLLTKRIWPRI